MGIIQLLDAQTSNRIAAGEVVDRPASALKELLENALDAGATKLSVEIRGGGRAFLRITDNGHGFDRDDMPKALLRHATSKIQSGSDLQEIVTFGFRGEALAAISSVSRMEIISCARGELVGTRLTSDETGVVMTDTGCPEGTTVIVRDLFYNTPARQKFLKRDVTEASACVAVASRAALSHPEVSFTVTVEGEKRFYTAGDGRLLPAIHAVYGKGFSLGLLPVEYALDGVRAHGFITSPEQSRGSRSMQMFYVNGRPVQSKTMMAALEEGYRSYLPHGKYPGAVLFIEIPYGLTDVNVHPAKLEIKFANERPVFSAVYYAVKNRLLHLEDGIDSERSVPDPSVSEETEPKPEMKRPASAVPISRPKPAEPETASVSLPKEAAKPAVFRPTLGEEDLDLSPMLQFAQPDAKQMAVTDAKQMAVTDAKQMAVTDAKQMAVTDAKQPEETAAGVTTGPSPATAPEEPVTFVSSQVGERPAVQEVMDERPYWKLIGEAYDAYLFVETESEVLVIDKHAAHERILYEQLASRKEVHTQELLAGIPIMLHAEEADRLLAEAEYLAGFGFVLEPFGPDTVLVRAVPSTLAGTRELQSILETFAAELAAGSRVSFAEKCDRALFTVACKAALKAGIPNDPVHNAWIVEQLMAQPSLRFCPHGRPVLHALPKREIEQYFDR